jgi:predicted permease
MAEILQDIASILFVLGLGYWAGRRGDFTQDQASGLLHLVLTYALPATLFVSIVRSTRAELVADGDMLLLAAIVLVGAQAASFAVARLVFHRDRREAAIASLVAGSPTVGFLGIAVLAPMFGAPSALAVAVVALVINLVQLPAVLLLLAPAGTRPGAAVARAALQPLVLVPFVAVLLVLADLRPPAFLMPPLTLMAHANSGVAVFAAGLVLAPRRLRFDAEVIWNSAVKLVLMPASMLFGALALGIAGDSLEQLVLLAALPSLFTGVVLAGRYEVYLEPASSTLIATSLAFAVAAPGWIAVLRAVAGAG